MANLPINSIIAYNPSFYTVFHLPTTINCNHFAIFPFRNIYARYAYFITGKCLAKDLLKGVPLMSFKEKGNLHPRRIKEPFADFISNMDQLFSGKAYGGVLQTMDQFFQSSSAKNQRFPVEVSEQKNAYMVRARLPGISKQQIHIEAHQQTLVINVQNKELVEQRDTNGNLIHSHSSSQIVSRNVNFTKPIDTSRIKAAHKDGLLEIIVPKKPGKEIKIIN